MKNILLALLIPCSLFAQKIEGLGSLKVGRTTTAIFIDSLKKEGYKLFPTTSVAASTGGFMRSKIISKYIHPKKGTNSLAPLVKGHDEYTIDYLMIGGIKFEDVYLDFWQDTLVRIKVYVPLLQKFEFNDVLTEKYGAPQTDSIITPLKCMSQLTGNFQVFDKEYFNYFNKNDNIQVYWLQKLSYDEHCRPGNIEIFFAENGQLYKQIEFAERKAKLEGKIDKQAF